ncbi:MAG: hypothetical protein JSR46_03605 [Verrucomicrobia bacterium]|nr:hypothetical protein [Verrucomicrobiota bacterium]
MQAADFKPMIICKNIFVCDDENQVFFDKVKSAIEILWTHDTGRRLIKKIKDGTHQITIIFNSNKNECIAQDVEGSKQTGVGSRSTIYINYKKLIISQSDIIHYGNDEKKVEYPFCIKVAHQLIYAYRNSYGKRSKEFEERKILGFEQYKKEPPKISVNSILLEHGLRVLAYTDDTLKQIEIERQEKFSPSNYLNKPEYKIMKTSLSALEHTSSNFNSNNSGEFESSPFKINASCSINKL